MATLLQGSLSSADEPAPRDGTLPLPIHAPATRGAVATRNATTSVAAGSDQVAHEEVSGIRTAELFLEPPVALGSEPASSLPGALPTPPRPGAPPAHRPNALPAMVLGVVDAAAVWVGLALFMIALVYPLSNSARFWLAMTGAWVLGAGLAYAITFRPERA